MARVALLMLAAAVPARDAAPSDLSDPAEIARRAEEEFQRGVELRGARDKAIPHFRIAALAFEELRRLGARNPELYRNLGNAYLLADDLPHALLSYRRGLRLDPNDADLQAGLAEARGRVVYAADGGFGRPAADPRPPWLPRLRSDYYFTAAAACYVASCFCLTRWLMTRRGRLLAAGVVAILAAAGLTALVIATVASEREEGDRPLVVVAEDGLLLRKGDGLAYPPRYETPLNKGVEARRLYERGDWLQIELAGGEVGWAPRNSLLVDDP